MELTEKTLSSQLIFDGKILKVYFDDIELPDGGKATREFIRHVGAVCIVALTDDGKIILEKQYRYPFGAVITEIPAGKLDSKEEDPLCAASRELKEETGVSAREMIYLGDFYPACAYSDEIIRIFLARGLSFGETSLDEDEFINVEKVPLEEAVRDIMEGKIKDGKTQAAVLKAFYYINDRAVSPF